jgi:lipopolysaccharide transport system ATP-binding protein
MPDIAIKVDKLAKLYRIGAQQQRHDTLRDALVDNWRSVIGRLRANGNNKLDHQALNKLWALRDISFDVHQGEILGIVGRNGAGKSTLLKILSRITAPTLGRVTVQGRLGSLLEVGTGFHPELTGRENVYLNGSIMGMRRAEINRRFDEIVAFAEIDQFLDTPVKRYSSGMYVRLAFAVAAHLEPEVLLVDEVLAVGDMDFQKKCLGKMSAVGHDGRTVLFVSHNMQAVTDLCSRAVLLNRGEVETIGTANEVVRRYLSARQTSASSASTVIDTGNFCIDRAVCYGPTEQDAMMPLKPCTIQIDVIPRLPTRDISLHLLIRNDEGGLYLGFDSVDFDAVAQTGPDIRARFVLSIPSCPLPPGHYYVDVIAKSYSTQVFDEMEQVVTFDVCEEPVYGTRRYERRWHGESVTPASMCIEWPA